MNTKLFALSMAAAAMMIAGCEEKPAAKTGGDMTGAVKDMADKAKEGAGKAVDATKDAAAKAADATKDAAAKAADATKDAAAKAADATKDAATKAADGVQGLLGGNKDGAVKFFTEKLDGAKTTIAEWAKKVEALPAPMKATVEPTFKSLTDKVGTFEKSLGDLKTAAGDGWKATTEKLFKDWGDIGGLMDKVKGMMK